MPRKCFEVFHEVFGKRFVLFSLGFVIFEVFRPVWALYNIKRGWDAPPGAPRAAPQKGFGLAATSSIVPGALVPDGHALACALSYAYTANTQCNAAILPCPSFCRALPDAYATNIHSIAGRFLAHLFVSHCPVQAETKCSGKLGGGCSVEQPVSI